MKEEIKLAIINGENSAYDGKIYCFNIDDQDLYHSSIFSKYIKENYGTDTELENIDLTNANSMMLFLREQGNIVFVNDTTYKDGKPDKHGKTGIFAMPNHFSVSQIESLRKLNRELEDYDGFQIWHSFESHTDCKNLFTRNKEQVKSIVEFFIENYANTKTK